MADTVNLDEMAKCWAEAAFGKSRGEDTQVTERSRSRSLPRFSSAANLLPKLPSPPLPFPLPNSPLPRPFSLALPFSPMPSDSPNHARASCTPPFPPAFIYLTLLLTFC